MRVAADGSAHGARRPCPCFQPGQAAADVQRTSPLIVTPASARTAAGPCCADLAAMDAEGQPTNAGVGDDHVRAAAEDRHRHAGVARESHGEPQLVAVRADRAASRRGRRPARSSTGASGASRRTRPSPKRLAQTDGRISTSSIAPSVRPPARQRPSAPPRGRPRTRSSRPARVGRPAGDRREITVAIPDSRRSSAARPSAGSAVLTAGPAAHRRASRPTGRSAHPRAEYRRPRDGMPCGWTAA